MWHRLCNSMLYFRKIMASSNSDELKKRAVAEILEETKRASARAEVRYIVFLLFIGSLPLLKIGGSLAWKKPRQGKINRTFLNKTVIGTVIQNNVVMKTDCKQKQNTSDLLKSSPALLASEKQEKVAAEAVEKISVDTNKTKKVVITNKSRLNAYLKSKNKNIENKNSG